MKGRRHLQIELNPRRCRRLVLAVVLLPLWAEVLYRVLGPLNFSLPPERYPEALALALVHWGGAALALVWPAHEVLRREASGERAWWQGQGRGTDFQLLAVLAPCLGALLLGGLALWWWAGWHGASVSAAAWGGALLRLATIAVASLLLVQLLPRMAWVLIAGALWLAVSHLPAVLVAGQPPALAWMLRLFPDLSHPGAGTVSYLAAYLLLASLLAAKRYPAP
ncbi:MAG: hypothetical protein Q7P63_01850 [Verrucomicrobiota bacterium JB022]|nr:hypothetical protein [Verrucomicrobiota bacterium JB022]